MSIMHQPIGTWMRARDEAAWMKWCVSHRVEGEPPRPEVSPELEPAYLAVWHARLEVADLRERASVWRARAGITLGFWGWLIDLIAPQQEAGTLSGALAAWHSHHADLAVEQALAVFNKCLAEVTRLTTEEQNVSR